jgi:hypothetical protein
LLSHQRLKIAEKPIQLFPANRKTLKISADHADELLFAALRKVYIDESMTFSKFLRTSTTAALPDLTAYTALI